MNNLRFGLMSVAVIAVTNLAVAGIGQRLGIGFNINNQKLYGNHATGAFALGGNPINFRLDLSPALFLDSDLGFAKSQVAVPGGTLTTDMINAGLRFGYRFFNDKAVNPLLFVGAGLINFRNLRGARAFDGYGALGAGAEIFVSDRFGLNVTADYRYTTGDEFDGFVGGKGRDALLNVALGVNYYFSGKRKDRLFDQQFSGEPVPVQETQTMSAPPEVDAARHAENMFKRNQLLYSLRNREKDIQLLQAKIAVLDRYANELRNKLGQARVVNATAEAGREREGDSYATQYRNALVLFQAGYFKNAISAFKSLLSQNPSHALTASTWYWLGESYYNASAYPDAVRAFSESARMTHEPLKGDMALLMRGLSRWKTGKTEAARTDFQKLATTRPESRVGQLAQEYLADLKEN